MINTSSGILWYDNLLLFQQQKDKIPIKITRSKKVGTIHIKKNGNFR